MHRIRFILCFVTGLVGLVFASATAGTYPLTDGHEISGEPITIKDDGVKLKTAAGTYTDKITWDKFTQEALQTLLSEAKTPNEKSIIEPLIEPAVAHAKSKAKAKDIAITPITPPSRPTENVGLAALFSSPLGILIVLILYGATIFAAYEVAVFRNHKVPVVCGLAAIPVLGVASPIAFYFLKPNIQMEAEAPAASTAPEAAETAVETAGAEPASATASPEAQTAASSAPAAPAPAQSALPAPIVFNRADFSFNRRFFETRFVAFTRVVPSEADKDMVVWIKAARGEFTGRRITQINPNDLHLQTFGANATADEMIPYVEMLEVQIRHKDL